MAEQVEEKEKVPIWIISFTDMVTLLLAFFAMLQTMAHERSAILFNAGQGSFMRAIESFGIPNLLNGQQGGVNTDYRKVRYPTDEAKSPEDPRSRVIDAEGDQVRKMFDELKNMIDTKSSDLPPKPLLVQVMPLAFDDDCEPTAPAVAQLKEFVANMRENTGTGASAVYVVGLANDQQQPRDQLIVSAKRATRVEARVREMTRQMLKQSPEVYSFGAGNGERWKDSKMISEKATIVIVVMGASQNGG